MKDREERSKGIEIRMADALIFFSASLTVGDEPETVNALLRFYEIWVGIRGIAEVRKQTCWRIKWTSYSR